MTKVVILGSTGMLGSAVKQAFEDFNGSVITTSRNEDGSSAKFVAGKDEVSKFLSGLSLESGDYVINCIGIIKPYIKDEITGQRENAIDINSKFPYELARFAEQTGVRVIQIATDCVYSGSKGAYNEHDLHDALDVYGKSKSLGEVPSQNVLHLRVSIIGPEVGRSTSLFEWVRNQPEASEITGYSDHLWNGVPTKHYGKLVRGIIESDIYQSGVFHVVPENPLTKFQLVSVIADISGRSDINIVEKPSGNVIDRTLSTVNGEFNSAAWRAAGYSEVPNVETIVREILS